MSALDTSIDDLYRLPLNEFTPARNTLAKSLSGADAKCVRALPKPTLVAWAVNQVFWHARGAYDRLMKSGERLRAAQIAALEGRHADVRAATETHRHAIADAVREAERLAAAAGSKPGADALARTFEALSVATGVAEPPGRLTQPLQPAGFEALAGVKPQAAAARIGAEKHASREPAAPANHARAAHADPHERPRAGTSEASRKRAAEAAREEARAQAAEAKRAELARRKHEAEVKNAEAALAQAEAAERRARAAWEQAHDEMLAARRAVTTLKSST
jgi:hypothetical protein